MLAPTHSVFGVFLTLTLLAIFGVEYGLHWSIIFFAASGAILPDIDHPTSVIGRLIPGFSGWLEKKFGHRTITHSLLGWVMASTGFFIIILPLFVISHLSLVILVWRWLIAFSTGYFSHLLLDMINLRGVQLFWPDAGRDVIPKNPKFRFKSGSKAELLIFILFFFLMLLSFPLSKYGLMSSLHWLLATPNSAIEEFKTSKTRTFLIFKGIQNVKRQPIAGRAEILGVDNQQLVILYQGRVYTLSNKLSSDITAHETRALKSRLPLSIKHRTFNQQTREALLTQIPSSALISGTIHLPPNMKVNFPPNTVDNGQTFKTIEQKGDTLLLSFARKEELEKLALAADFALQKQQAAIEFARLQLEADRLKNKIKTLNGEGNLTELGKSLLISPEEAAKQREDQATLANQLAKTRLKIAELLLQSKEQKLVFSGEVSIRQVPAPPKEVRLTTKSFLLLLPTWGDFLPKG